VVIWGILVKISLARLLLIIAALIAVTTVSAVAYIRDPERHAFDLRFD
jgi:hypothetical protein